MTPEQFTEYQQFADDLTFLDKRLKNSVALSFKDGSSAFFNNAFFFNREDVNQIAVFTQNCGFHVYPKDSVVEAKTLITDEKNEKWKAPIVRKDK